MSTENGSAAAQLARAVLASNEGLERCGFDRSEETGKGPCDKPATHDVVGPHDMQCGAYCVDHAVETIATRCEPPHRFYKVERGGIAVAAMCELAQTVLRTDAELTQERDAALAAVDAVRADYAPRQEPPTAEEVRALARLWPHHDGAAVVLLRVLSRTGDRVAPHAVSVIVENDGTVEGFAANDMDKLHRADGWRAECPDGPVAWSHLAAMVARGGDRG